VKKGNKKGTKFRKNMIKVKKLTNNAEAFNRSKCLNKKKCYQAKFLYKGPPNKGFKKIIVKFAGKEIKTSFFKNMTVLKVKFGNCKES